VLDDLLDGYITVEHAREVYAVVFKPVSNGYDWGLDMPATEALRAKVKSGQHA
jgi:N-methylhydantoinase B